MGSIERDKEKDDDALGEEKCEKDVSGGGVVVEGEVRTG